MTNTGPTTHPEHGGSDDTPATDENRRSRTTIWFVGALLVLVVVIVAAVWARRGSSDGNDGRQTVDVGEQGSPDAVRVTDGGRLLRQSDGLGVEVVVPTPVPGTYDYPTSDMIPPWVESHPAVGPGAQDAPEVFTLWLFAFNDPGSCTEGQCDSDDVGIDAAARGGVYQIDGRIADGDTLRLTGTARLGQAQLDGAPLENPLGAEVHLAIAPHGRALSGPDLVTQLNTPVGNPTLWWGARFRAPSNG